MTMASLRTMIFPSSACSLRSIQPSAFSSFQAPRHYSIAGITQQSGTGNIGSATKFPWPETIPWQEELCNKVHLIGSIGKIVQLKYTETGNAFAWTKLRTKLDAKATETTWFLLKFWDEMAKIAAKHVKTGDRVYVSGSMNSEETEATGLLRQNRHGWHSLLIQLNGGTTEKIRGIQEVLISSTRVQVKHYGLKAIVILHGLNQS